MSSRFVSFASVFALVLAGGCGDSATGGGGTGGTPADGGGPPTGGAPAGAGGEGAGPTAGGGGQGEGGTGGEAAPLCGPDLPEVSFATDIQPILTTSCAKTNCHLSPGPDAGLDLEEGLSYAELVGVATSQCFSDRTRIIPGDPEESYLFDKIRNKDLCGTTKRMPYPPAAMLTPEQLTLFEAWICAGALDN